MSLVVECAGTDGPWSFLDASDFERRYGQQAVLLFARGPGRLAWRSWLPATVWLARGGRWRIEAAGASEDLQPGVPFLTGDGEQVSLGAPGPAGDAALFGLVLPRGRRLAVGAAGFDVATDPPTLRLDGAVALAAALSQLALRRGLGPGGRDGDLDEVLDALRRELLRLEPLVARCPGKGIAQRRALLRRLLRARRRLEAAEGVDVPLAALAAAAGLSPWHFLRVFRRVFGETPHELATRLRVDLACRLVLRTDLPLAEVGQRVGIPNRSAFAQFFRHHLGVPASRLRVAHADGAAPAPG